MFMKDKMILIKVSEEFKKKLEAVAKDKGMNNSELIRTLIEIEYSKLKQKK